MLRVPIAEARMRLEALVAGAARGEEVVIEGDGASVRLVAEPVGHPDHHPAAPGVVPVFGRSRGAVLMRDDFDHPVPGFEDYT